MEETTPKNIPFTISKEVLEETNSAIREAFGTLTKHVKQLAEDFGEFSKTREDMRRRMANGARRTDGQIV